MRVVLFCHSLVSDWNHGNAHFLRGVATELIKRGNQVEIYEPQNSWSLTNLLQEHGEKVLTGFRNYYPLLTSTRYDIDNLPLDSILKDADLVLVHEWTEHKLVSAIGKYRKKYDFKLLFHDTHHRAVTERESIKAYDLSNYDGVLAFGKIIADIYLQHGWIKKAWAWHEAADTNIFKPLHDVKKEGDFVWIGNWGDGERTKELFEFIIDPIKKLGLTATIYGVRYPEHAIKALQDAGIHYGGWLPNFKAPEIFAQIPVYSPRPPRTLCKVFTRHTNHQTL